jgi:nucleotide-binding universal stress UspA family protein
VSNAVWKVLSLGVTLVATKVATDAASKGWKLATGRAVPVKGDFEGERTRDVVAYTALSSMLVTGARVAAERKAAEYYRNSTGHLPKGIEDAFLTKKERKARHKLEKAKAKAQKKVAKATA